MRSVFAIAAAGAILIVGAIADQANAMAVGTPAGLRAAINEGAVADLVHCVPGWKHHVASWGLWNGCSRVVRSRPRLFVAPRRRVIIVR